MAPTHKAFVSSTYIDLKDHRAHVIRALRRSGILVDPMEDWTALGPAAELQVMWLRSLS